MLKLLKRVEPLALRLVQTIGRVVVSPTPPRATGAYGLACRGGLILLFLIGLVVSWPFTGAGLGLMIVASLALTQFFVLQYQGALLRATTLAWLAAVMVVLCVVIGLVWSSWPAGDGTAGDVMVLASLAAALAVLPIVRMLFRVIFGPHHPESDMPAADGPVPLWFWIGGVGPDAATVVVRVADETRAEAVNIKYHDGTGSPRSASSPLDGHRLARITLNGLEPDRLHHLDVQASNGEDVVATVKGSFTTFPPAGAPTTMCLAFASCMSTGSRGRVFDTIGETTPRPRLFMVTGDLHYENLTTDRPERFLEAYDRVHASHPLGRLYRSIPMAYVWDDHDYGDNDSDHRSRSKAAAQAAYRMAVPSYLDPERSGAIHQEFSIGRVRVVVTDNRSERSETPGHLLSRTSEQWLVERIVDPNWPVVIWVSPTPWISADDGSDNWGAYAEQRARIAAAIGDRAANLVMVSGDAHMVAIDDGSHSAYAGPGSGFPVLHAAALDRGGSTKGGEFSHGKFPGGGQFGIVDIEDRIDEIVITLSGRNWTGAEIVSHSFTITPDPGLTGRQAKQDDERDVTT